MPEEGNTRKTRSGIGRYANSLRESVTVTRLRAFSGRRHIPRESFTAIPFFRHAAPKRKRRRGAMPERFRDRSGPACPGQSRIFPRK